jgi:hypothetical protein
MFVVLIDRVRQRIMTTVRILFLVALVAVLTVQLYGLVKAGITLRSGGGVVKPAFERSPSGLMDALARDLQRIYLGR